MIVNTEAETLLYLPLTRAQAGKMLNLLAQACELGLVERQSLEEVRQRLIGRLSKIQQGE